jgi:hypothetical protein
VGNQATGASPVEAISKLQHKRYKIARKRHRHDTEGSYGGCDTALRGI